MTAIAQTLDGKETFETKKELFDYVFSQLFPLADGLVGCWLFDDRFSYTT